MEGKHDMISDEVVATCRAKHLRDVMSFQNNWNNEIITQFYDTLYVEERGDTRNFHWMTKRMRYEITFEQFARLFGFGRNDANHHKIHYALCHDANHHKIHYALCHDATYFRSFSLLCLLEPSLSEDDDS
jgi:hypothetical protein